MKSHRVAVVVSHPIQHFCPQYSSWALLPDVDLRVFFASEHGLTAYEDKNFGKTIQWHGLQMDFPHEFLPGSSTREVSNSMDSVELNVRLSAFSPHVLVIYGYSQRLQRHALGWAKNHKIPIIMVSDSELRAQRNWLILCLKTLFLPLWLRSCSVFLTTGDANEAYYRHYGVPDEKLIRCFFPIDVKKYDNILSDKSIARQRIREKLGIPNHHSVILNVGKLVSWKRQCDLVSFSNSLQGRYQDVTVILAGTGQDETALRALCQREGPGGVIFAGFISPDELIEYYCAADIYAACSEREPHSLAISEAIYCGLPVVISDRCGSYGPSDDVRQGLNGFVYRCGEVSELSRRILFILQDTDIHTQMSKASAKISRQHQALAHGEALTQALVVISANYTEKTA